MVCKLFIVPIPRGNAWLIAVGASNAAGNQHTELPTLASSSTAEQPGSLLLQVMAPC